jgi:hypothetical protein
VRASTAHALSGVLKYRMPLICSGVDLIVAELPMTGAEPRFRRYTHARLKPWTLFVSILVRALNRRPE